MNSTIIPLTIYLERTGAVIRYETRLTRINPGYIRAEIREIQWDGTPYDDQWFWHADNWDYINAWSNDHPEYREAVNEFYNQECTL
jgi:hypothetical protein